MPPFHHQRALVWFRRDLRMADHSALYHALERAQQVWCVFVFDPGILAAQPKASRRVEFIRASLVELDATLRWVDSRDTNSSGAIVTVPSYVDMDVRLGWQPTEKIELSLVGQNLLHSHHPEYFSDPARVEIQRSVYAKFTWHF